MSVPIWNDTILIHFRTTKIRCFFPTQAGARTRTTSWQEQKRGPTLNFFLSLHLRPRHDNPWSSSESEQRMFFVFFIFPPYLARISSTSRAWYILNSIGTPTMMTMRPTMKWTHACSTAGRASTKDGQNEVARDVEDGWALLYCSDSDSATYRTMLAAQTIPYGHVGMVAKKFSEIVQR